MKTIEKYSIASRNRMLSLPKDVLSAKMSALAKARHAKMSTKDKEKLGKSLARARRAVKKSGMV